MTITRDREGVVLGGNGDKIESLYEQGRPRLDTVHHEVFWTEGSRRALTSWKAKERRPKGCREGKTLST